MKTLYVMQGVSGSGKSSLAARIASTYPPGEASIHSTDNLFIDETGNYKFDPTKLKENHLRNLRNVIDDMKNGVPCVIVDNTNIRQREASPYIESANLYGYNIQVVRVQAPIIDCGKRNLHGVPTWKIRHRHRAMEDLIPEYDFSNYKYPKVIKGLTLPAAIICDLDGTLSHMGDRDPYDASTSDQDEINRPVALTISHLWQAGFTILFVSARDEKDRAPTLRFLEKVDKEYPVGATGPHRPAQLFMRPSGDLRRDSIVKIELFDKYINGKYNVEFCLDDRSQVIKEAWRGMGLTAFQVADGNF